jgi:hypothetical protein
MTLPLPLLSTTPLAASAAVAWTKLEASGAPSRTLHLSRLRSTQ